MDQRGETYPEKTTWREGMALFADPADIGQECSAHGFIFHEHRRSQELFSCDECGYRVVADGNAEIIAHARAVYVRLARAVNGAADPAEAGI